MLHHPGLYVRKDDLKGRGVYAGLYISKDDLIEIAHIILLPSVDFDKIHASKLHDYYFLWDVTNNIAAIALGYGSLYNHSSNPNTIFELDKTENVIKFYATKEIEVGQEITINYHQDVEQKLPLWFEES